VLTALASRPGRRDEGGKKQPQPAAVCTGVLTDDECVTYLYATYFRKRRRFLCSKWGGEGKKES
jgi:hypothetical protein